jgi:23S rRNA (guanosine2251-2'-O)-methyltransferase
MKITVEGRNPVIELLKSKRDVKRVILEETINRTDPKIHEIIMRASNRKVFIDYLSRKKLGQLSETNSHQGVIAIANVDYAKFSEVIENNIIHHLSNTFVYIREALYEDNIGAIARSAEAAGFSGIVIPPKMEITPQAFRSSMGALSNIKIVQESLFNAIKTAQKNAIKVIGIELIGSTKYYQTDLTGDVMLIIGGEDRSLSEEVASKCDAVVNIPMHGKINSLNMSVAAAVVVFEKLRQEAWTGD